MALPAKDGLGLHEEHRVSPAREESRQKDQHATLVRRELGTLARARSDDELLTQENILGYKLPAGTGHVANQGARAGPSRRSPRIATCASTTRHGLTKLWPKSSRSQGRSAAKGASRLFPYLAVCTTTTGAPHDARTT